MLIVSLGVNDCQKSVKKKEELLLAQRNNLLVTEKMMGEDGLWYFTYTWNNFHLTTWISETPKAV